MILPLLFLLFSSSELGPLATRDINKDITQFPSCAIAPALEMFSRTPCAITDMKCIRSQADLMPELSTKIKESCNPAEYERAVETAIAVCRENGVEINF